MLSPAKADLHAPLIILLALCSCSQQPSSTPSEGDFGQMTHAAQPGASKGR